MLPSIDLGFIEIPLYGPMFLIGFVLAMIMIRKLAPKVGVEKNDALFAAVYGAIGLVIGAKVLYLITKLPNIIKSFSTYIEWLKADQVGALNYAIGGMVFYGGLIGFCLGVLRYCVHFKVKLFDIADLYTPFLPFAHAFGRIGCFCAGCCYGMEYHGPLSVHFPYNDIVPELSLVPRLPVQLIEAGLNFICFGVLLGLMLKDIKRKPAERKLKQGRLLGFYLTYYLIIRTVLEFFRGDAVRGKVGFLSTSQIISILLIPIAIYFIIAKNKAPIFAGVTESPEMPVETEKIR